ncbi:MFS transporter [Paenarthrobacter nitroguajacolicus]|uniref:MFS transporter n=1 Tax=Paenarthrobacter nitroguajacolicus TaxID=211146 RepID=UPI002866937E|nr:MFS transporter [Paenarthrobacter nitroguajacolicus]MDR6639436.1 sugar phosphate permease [Paenarthrobacter nitroguajacolicus]
MPYFTCYLDRSNISYAALRMNVDIGLSETAFGVGAGIFFIGYVLVQVPANLMLTRLGPRRWIGIIAVVWGIIALSMFTVQGQVEFTSSGSCSVQPRQAFSRASCST